MINGLSSSGNGYTTMKEDGEMVELETSEHSNTSTDNHNGELSDNDEEELQKELDTLLLENKQLKRKRLKDKIEELRRENSLLKAHIESEEQQSNSDSCSSTTQGDGKITIIPYSNNMKAQSFIFTSSAGGTLYIKPIDMSSSDLEKLSIDGIIDSVADYDNSYAYSMGGWSKPLNFPAFCTQNGDKHIMQNNGSQTPPQYDIPQTTQPYVAPCKSGKQHVSYPRLKAGTTHEDIEARRFVQEFKTRRVSHKLTQSDIGDRLNRCTGARYGQSYISRLESMQLSTAIVLRMKPLLNKLLNETEYGRSVDNGEEGLYYSGGRKKSKKTARRKNTSENSSPSGQEIDDAIHTLPPFNAMSPHELTQLRPPGAPLVDKGGHWQHPYHMPPHHHNIPTSPYQQQHHQPAPNTTPNFFISDLMSSMNPGVPHPMSSKVDPMSCPPKSEHMALSHHTSPGTQMFNPYRNIELKHEMIELSPVLPQPTPPHSAPPHPQHPGQAHPGPPHSAPPHPGQAHSNQLQDMSHSAFSPNIHDLGSIKIEIPQITTLEPSIKPG